MPLIARFLLFFVLSGALLFGMHWYLHLRLVKDLTSKKFLRKAAWVLLLALTVGSLGARLMATAFPGIGGRSVIIGLLVWWGVAIYVTMALLPFEFARAWRQVKTRLRPELPADVTTESNEALSPHPAPTRRDALSLIAAGSALVVGGGVAVLGARRAFAKPEVTEVALRISRLPKALDGLKLVHLTDIHVGPLIQQHFLQTLVEVANAQKPDVVVITGDLVDGKVSVMGQYVKELQRLQSKYGTHFVTGNHDFYSGADEWSEALTGLGMTVLRNRFVSIGDKGASIDLVGVDDPLGSVSGTNLSAFETAFEGRDSARACLLLAHRPNDFAQGALRKVDLQLSGHTHGGQMFPATLIADVMWGARSRGLSKSGDSYLYVSRGCGFVGPPLRVGSAPEVVKFTLSAA